MALLAARGGAGGHAMARRTRDPNLSSGQRQVYYFIHHIVVATVICFVLSFLHFVRLASIVIYVRPVYSLPPLPPPVFQNVFMILAIARAARRCLANLNVNIPTLAVW